MTTFTKNGIAFSVDPQVSRYGEQRVVATFDGQTTAGKLPGTADYAFPRIEFLWSAVTDWLRKHADHQGWIVDEYETDEECRQRPTDSITFDLSPEIVAAINAERVNETQPAQQPTRRPQPQREFAESIFGIGALNQGDGAEIQTPTPTNSAGCQWENGTRYEETCAACGKPAFEICNHCGCCEKCHGSTK